MKADLALSSAGTTAPRLRLRVVALTVTVVLGLTLLGGAIAAGVIHAGKDPFETVPQLRLGIDRYMIMPTLGRTYRAGDVDAVLLAAVRMAEGGWALHFVLRAEEGLDRYHTYLVPAGGHPRTAVCAASGYSGWGECYVQIPPDVGPRVELELRQQRGRVEGTFVVDLSALA